MHFVLKICSVLLVKLFSNIWTLSLSVLIFASDATHDRFHVQVGDYLAMPPRHATHARPQITGFK